MTPYLTHSPRGNGHHLTYEALASPKPALKPLISVDLDAYELQTLANQRSTSEAFDELEHLVLNGIACEATISELSSLLYDQDDDAPISRKSTGVSHANHS